MRIVRATLDPSVELDAIACFYQQKALADQLAKAHLEEPMLLSWFDARRGIESPNGVSECGHASPDAGVRQYAEARGGELAVELQLELNSGSDSASLISVFCYLDLGE